MGGWERERKEGRDEGREAERQVGREGWMHLRLDGWLAGKLINGRTTKRFDSKF